MPIDPAAMKWTRAHNVVDCSGVDYVAIPVKKETLMAALESDNRESLVRFFTAYYALLESASQWPCDIVIAVHRADTFSVVAETSRTATNADPTLKR